MACRDSRDGDDFYLYLASNTTARGGVGVDVATNAAAVVVAVVGDVASAFVVAAAAIHVDRYQNRSRRHPYHRWPDND